LGFGAGQRLKLVVLPLNALIFNENFASGAKEASDAAKAEAEEKAGFKDIL
jgi:hypothetical protein